MELERHEAPIPDRLADELVGFWEALYGASYDAFRAMLRGSEVLHNSDIVYVHRQAGRVVGTCHLTAAKAVPGIAGLGEVGTAADYRRRGIGHELCKAARDDFRESGGEAIFLGTANPDAARLYERLGWRSILGSNVMVSITIDAPPETFLAEYFRGGGGAIVSKGSPADRVPMIPLIVHPHEWRVLDANTKIYSTRHAVQESCMGLYPRYEVVAAGGKGAWFAARTAQGKTVGLGTVRIEDGRHARIDAFVHGRFMSAWEALVRATIRWSASRGASACSASVCAEDEEKLSLLAKSGFAVTGTGKPFDLGGRSVASVRTEMSLGPAGPGGDHRT